MRHKEIRELVYPTAPEERFASVVTRILTELAANFGVSGDWEVRASAEFTHGIKCLNTVVGPVDVVTVLGGPRVFEVRCKP